MKKRVIFLIAIMSGVLSLKAQLTVSPALDVYSSYVWRGTQLSGPSYQPSVVATINNLSIGVWGSFDFTGIYKEADLYLTYAFPFGLSVTATDYYFPGLKYFDYSDSSGSHAFELGLSYTLFEKLTLSGYYIFNEAGGVASKGKDKYFEISYAFTPFSLSIGAGDGWHTTDGELNICHVGIKSTKEIKISETLSLPVTGAVIFNPEREQLYVTVGISF